MASKHPFADLRARMTPEARERAVAKAKALGAEMDLADIRRALSLSQETLAQTLGVGQAEVSKLEKRTDMYVSSMRRLIEAMGGELRIVAHFAGRDVLIQNFGELRAPRRLRAG